MFSISLSDGTGRYPILDIIGKFTNNRYKLYLAFNVCTESIKRLTYEEVSSKIENNDYSREDVQLIEAKIKGGHEDMEELLTTSCCYVGNVELLNVLEKNNLLSKRDFQSLNRLLSTNNYYRMINVNVLEWFKVRGIIPDVKATDLYCQGGEKNTDLNVLEWLKSNNILPSSHGANMALSLNNIKVLNWLKNNNIFPNMFLLVNYLIPSEFNDHIHGSLKEQCDNSCVNYLNWLEENHHEELNNWSINSACCSGCINALEWCKERGFMPTVEIVDNACIEGDITVNALEWLKKNNIVPSRETIIKIKANPLTWTFKDWKDEIKEKWERKRVSSVLKWLEENKTFIH